MDISALLERRIRNKSKIPFQYILYTQWQEAT